MIVPAPKKLVDLIGNTPLVDLSSILDRSVSLYAKCEFMNPGLSMKDRMIKYILLRAECEKNFIQGTQLYALQAGIPG